MIDSNSLELINTVYANKFLDDEYRSVEYNIDSLVDTLLELIYKSKKTNSLKITWTTDNTVDSQGKDVFVEIYDRKDGKMILQRKKLFDTATKGEIIEKEYQIDSSYQEIAIKLISENTDGTKCSKLSIDFDGLIYNFTKEDNEYDNRVGWISKDSPSNPQIRWYTRL